ncbi:MAG: hypothetical protein H6R15_1339 [Proteobacteria bacterium]|nr:hypothetical protein [Pseudomonadota bacterium]
MRFPHRPALPLYPLLLALFCLAPGARAADSAPTKPLLFGVLNQQSPIQTAEKWNPLLRYLSQKTGIPLQLKMGHTVEQTDAMMGREEFDLVFTNHNFQTEYDGKYKVLVRWAGRPIHGSIVVLENSPARQLKDLQGRLLSFPSLEAFAGYAVAMVALKDAGVTVKARFAGNQEGALAQLKAGQVDAAAVNSSFLEPYAEREKLRYRQIFISEPYYELPVIIHPRVPAEQVAILRHALLDMRHDPSAAALLQQARSPGFEAADEAAYDNVRRIYRAIGQ